MNKAQKIILAISLVVVAFVGVTLVGSRKPKVMMHIETALNNIEGKIERSSLCAKSIEDLMVCIFVVLVISGFVYVYKSKRKNL